jgi:hypothetical protein
MAQPVLAAAWFSRSLTQASSVRWSRSGGNRGSNCAIFSNSGPIPVRRRPDWIAVSLFKQPRNMMENGDSMCCAAIFQPPPNHSAEIGSLFVPPEPRPSDCTSRLYVILRCAGVPGCGYGRRSSRSTFKARAGNPPAPKSVAGNGWGEEGGRAEQGGGPG